MSEKRNVLLAQANYRYGDNVYIPYSAGRLQAYCNTLEEIRSHFYFFDPIFLRDDPVDVIHRVGGLSVLGLSCYIWNWEYNKRLARAIKIAYPNVLVVLGGTQVPDASDGFFLEHPYVDILVHHEGEFTFGEVLIESLSEHPDYSKIAGISIRGEGNQTLKTVPRDRIRDLSKLPSPYLSGVFDFMLDKGYSLSASQETNRGCPYTCTYCDWGGNTYDKIVPIVEQALIEEFEWFGKNHVEFVYNCDANYGILPRDHELTRKMVEMRTKNDGYPRAFRMCTAKNSNDKIFAIIKILNDAGMNKGAALSFQSMDDNTLGIIKRKNIKIQNFEDLMRKYREAGMVTYTELIMGLPGETYETSKRGVDTLIDGQDETINLYAYVCTALPNSEMSGPDYMIRHGIRYVRMPILLAHSTQTEEDSLEYHNVVIETATMPQTDWQRTYMFYWAIQCFHSMGLLQHVAILFRKQFGLKYSDFYEKMIEYFTFHNETLVGRQIAFVRRTVDESTRGGRLDAVLPKFGNICWPLDEATFLNLADNKERFYEEIRSFIGSLAVGCGFVADSSVLDDVVSYQSFRIIDPASSESVIELQHDLHGYFSTFHDPASAIQRVSTRLTRKPKKNFVGDTVGYAREVVWYGRKGGRFHHADISSIIV